VIDGELFRQEDWDLKTLYLIWEKDHQDIRLIVSIIMAHILQKTVGGPLKEIKLLIRDLLMLPQSKPMQIRNERKLIANAAMNLPLKTHISIRTIAVAANAKPLGIGFVITAEKSKLRNFSTK